MSVNVILATELNYGIGNENKLPWPKNKKDMEWFRNNTKDGVVLMGRKTWESIGSKKLPNRINIVVTSRDLEGPDYTISGDMADIISNVKERYPGHDIWVMGGSEIYFQAIPLADKLYLTTINGHYECDSYVESDIIVKFPIIEYWKEDEDITFQIRKKV